MTSPGTPSSDIFEPNLIVPHHFSTALITGRIITGHTIELVSLIGGKIDQETGMIDDLSKVKRRIRDAVDSALDHSLVLSRSHFLNGILREHGQKVFPLTTQAGLADTVRKIHALLEEILCHGRISLTLNELIVRSGSEGYSVTRGKGSVSIEDEQRAPKEIIEATCHMTHRLHKYDGACNNLHGHTWTVTVDYEEVALPREAEQYVQSYVEKTWNNKVLLHEGDPLYKILADGGFPCIKFQQPPTTEIIGAIMLAHIRDKFPALRIRNFTLRETPSNAVTWKNKSIT